MIMNDEVRYIIEHMSPVELCMLEDRGVTLSPSLAQRAAIYRRGVDLVSQWTPHLEAKRALAHQWAKEVA